MSGAQAWVFQWRRWDTGSRGREAVVTAAPSRDRDAWRNQKTREGIPESQQRHRPEDVREVWRGPVLDPEGREHPGNRRRRPESRRSQVKHTEVLERVYDPGRLWAAWQQVKHNAGAAGIDQMTVEEFEARQEELLELIQEKLRAGIYRFKPARRALIPKGGSTSQKRKLGIPVVMDRVVAQSIHRVFDEIFDPEFTGANFGFRRGKSQHQAIEYGNA